MSTNPAQSPPRLLFLGTGAADWPWNDPPQPLPPAPGAWRRKTLTLVDDAILLDAGPSLSDALATFAVDPGRITDLLFTHTHSDHCDLASIEALLTARGSQPPLRIWSPDPLPGLALAGGCVVQRIRPWETIHCQSYAITALPANHHVAHDVQGSGTPLHYLFEGHGSRWLYALDGAWLRCEVRYHLEHLSLDALVIDATIGDIPDDYRVFEHNALPMIRLMVASLRRAGMLRPHAPVILSHLARTLHGPQAEIEALVADQGWTVAYDGAIIHLPTTEVSST